MIISLNVSRETFRGGRSILFHVKHEQEVVYIMNQTCFVWSMSREH